MNHTSKLARANALIDRALDEVNEYEPIIAATKLLDDLRKLGFRPGDIMLILRDTPDHTQLLDMHAEYRLISKALEELREKYLALLAKRAPSAEPASAPRPPALPMVVFQPLKPKPPRPKRSGPKAAPIKAKHRLTHNQLTENYLTIMVGLRSLGKCTVRELSYHLYNKSDDNTVLDDALKRLMERNLVQRRVIQAHERKAYGRSTYLWNLTQDGAKIIEKSKA